MIRQVVYDSTIYHHQQAQALIRALQRCGWRLMFWVEAHRAPPRQPLPSKLWWCCAESLGWAARGEAYGDSLWDCLSKVVQEVVLPAESGSAR